LYGRSNALALAVDYYADAVWLWKKQDPHKSMFFLGAALHLVQDVTIPQHVNIRLLEDHRQYENFVKRTYQNIDAFQAYQKAYVLSTIENYVKFNARTALKVYKRFRGVSDDEDRYYRITRCTLPLAERTTAGALITFYNNVVNKK
jgi:phospholipase C